MAVVKLDSGYNIGVNPGSCIFLEHPVVSPTRRPEVVQNASLPTLSIVSTGGTIASRIDYRTGSVTSQFDAGDILTAIPELATIANYRTKPIATILSENMTPAIWRELARAVHAEIRAGSAGEIGRAHV
jgi:glutamyl-tRNA(Gln) amidotransferase subunit D